MSKLFYLKMINFANKIIILMKNSMFLIIVTLSANLCFSQAEKPEFKAVADNFVRNYNQNMPDEIYKMFAEVMQKAMPLDKTTEFVSNLRNQAGKIVSKEFYKYFSTAAQYITKFENMTLIMQISIDKSSKIDGFYFKAYTPDNIHPSLKGILLS